MAIKNPNFDNLQQQIGNMASQLNSNLMQLMSSQSSEANGRHAEILKTMNRKKTVIRDPETNRIIGVE